MPNDHDARPETRSETSPGLPATWRTAEAALGETTAAGDVLRQWARLVAAYGDGRVADSAQRQLLLREWLEAVGRHSPRHLHDAVGRLIRSGKYWPTIAEVCAECEIVRKAAIEAVQAGRRAALPRPENNGFAREGRTDEQEMAFRAEVIAKARARHGYGVQPQGFRAAGGVAQSVLSGMVPAASNVEGE